MSRHVLSHWVFITQTYPLTYNNCVLDNHSYNVWLLLDNSKHELYTRRQTNTSVIHSLILVMFNTWKLSVKLIYPLANNTFNSFNQLANISTLLWS